MNRVFSIIIALIFIFVLIQTIPRASNLVESYFDVPNYFLGILSIGLFLLISYLTRKTLPLVSRLLAIIAFFNLFLFFFNVLG